MQAPTRHSTSTIHDLLFADDRALNTTAEEDMQRSMGLFAFGCAHYGLTINTEKTVIMHQHPSTAECSIPLIRINGAEAKTMDNFNYLGSAVSRCIRIDEEVARRILKASQAYGRLQNPVWNRYDLKLNTELKMHKAAVPTITLQSGHPNRLLQPCQETQPLPSQLPSRNSEDECVRSPAMSSTGATFKLGVHGLAVPMELHKLNRANLCCRIQKVWSALAATTGGAPTQNLDGVYILLQGGSAVSHGGSDCDDVFRQESYFHWAFGGLEPDWYGAIEVSTQRAILFVPEIPDSVAVYVGDPLSRAQIAERYAVDEVYFTNEICNFFTDHKAALLLTLYGLNTDSGRHTTEAKFDGIEKFKVNNEILHHEISECRCIKTALELDVIRYAVKASSAAHRHLMRNVKAGMFQFQAESLFLNYCYFHGGMRHVAYTCIAATGCDCAVLHYGHAGAPNERLIRDGDMCLFDMGAGYTKNTPARSTHPGLRNLRTARELQANMVLTVEPGCYFISRLLDEAAASPVQSQFLVTEKLQQFRKFGGVRIEEDVLITETGCEVLSDVPRTVAEIESWMAAESTEYDRVL
nr:unnamed protein product [Spirometra erinaceieuropaei]